jgi:hypothetical protein
MQANNAPPVSEIVVPETEVDACLRGMNYPWMLVGAAAAGTLFMVLDATDWQFNFMPSEQWIYILFSAICGVAALSLFFYQVHYSPDISPNGKKHLSSDTQDKINSITYKFTAILVGLLLFSTCIFALSASADHYANMFITRSNVTEVVSLTPIDVKVYRGYAGGIKLGMTIVTMIFTTLMSIVLYYSLRLKPQCRALQHASKRTITLLTNAPVTTARPSATDVQKLQQSVAHMDKPVM